LTLAVLLAACVLPVSRACAGESPAEREKKLLEVLNGNASKAEKAITCKRLLLCGSGASVPALAALLSDAELASWARIALEGIPDPVVDSALRAEVDKLKGRLQIGVINSLGMRRDAKAIDVLSGRLKDADVEVVAAAAAAMGRIGGDQATKALLAFLPSSPAPARADVAEACLICADQLTKDGKNDEAAKIYETVRKADVPKQRVLEAIRGEILARKAAGIPLLLEQLRSDDKAFFGIGLRTARELPCSEATDALVAEIGKAKPERQALLVLALTDRGDPKALPTILAVIQKGPKEATLAGLSTMERIGNASCVPVLAKVAAEGEKDEALAAKAALVNLPGADIDAQIATQLSQTTGKTRQVLIEVVGFRRAESSASALVPLLEDADASVRSTAAVALAALGGAKEVPALVKALLKAQNADERSALERALTGSAARGGAACTAQLLPLAQNNDTAVRVIVLHALVCSGGPDALNAVKTALNDKDEGVQDEAVRTLSTWPNRWPEDAGIAEPLLTLAKTGTKPLHKILGLQGYLRHLLGCKLGGDEKLAKVNDVLPLATRVEEKRLVTSVLGSVCSARSLEMLLELTGEAGTAEEASSGIVALGDKSEWKGLPGELRQKALLAVLEKARSRDTKRKANELMKSLPKGIQKASGKLKIVKALYGALPDGNKADVTAKVQEMVTGDTLSVDASNDNFGDPAGGMVKKLRVEYEFDGAKKSKEVDENGTLTISNKGE
jgi:HEAT repeat protein